MRDYKIWYWTEGPGKGQGIGGSPVGSVGLPDPPPITPEVAPAPPVVQPPAEPPPVEQTFVNWGRVIPISMGERRMSPQIIWLKAPVVIGVTSTADFAVSWGYNADDDPAKTECTALYADGTRIWTNGEGASLPGSWSWHFYPGTESQGQDATMVADKGAANTPAYRNQMYGVFRNFPLEKFGFKLPGISAEISGFGGELPRVDYLDASDKAADVEVLGNLQITKKSVSQGATLNSSGIRSRYYHRRGSYYMEVTAVRIDPTWHGIGIGVSTAVASLDVHAGVTADGAGAFYAVSASSDNVWSGSERTTFVPAMVQGDVIGVHIDMNAGWLRARNVTRGGAWSAPVWYVVHLPSKPIANIALGDALHAHVSVSMWNYPLFPNLPDIATVNFGATAFAGAIPAGATAWNGSGGTTDIGELPLRRWIEKVAIYAGLDPATDLDFVDIDDVVHGGLITNDTIFRDFLAVLGRAYGFDFYEGNVIRIVKRVVAASYTIDKVIPPEDLLTDSDRAITTTRRKDDTPMEIELNYIDRTQQFRWNLQKARRILFPVRTTQSDRKDSFSIPIITTANDALTCAGRALYREAMQNVEHDADLMTRHLNIEPSDIITLTAADTSYTVKVAEVSFEADMKMRIRAVNLLTDEDMTFNAEAGEPALPYAGNVAYMQATEGADRFQAVQFLGVLAAHEGADRFAGLQLPPVTATMAATDRPDVFAGVGGVAYATLNGSPITAVTLSNGNLTATNTGNVSTDQGARSATSKTTGKYYFEVTFVGSHLGGGNVGAGIGTTASGYAQMGGTATTGNMCFRASGNIYANGSNSGTSLGALTTANTVLALAIDLDNRRIWFKKVSGTPGNWNNSGTANPATNTGGITIPAGTMIPFATFGGSSGVANNVQTFNFGASAFTATVPSGFTSGWPA